MSKQIADTWTPRLKYTKNGKTVIARPHEATFKGRHNACKSKVLIVLYKIRGYPKGLSLSELARDTGVKYSYLESRLGKWVQWDYIDRKIKQGDNRPVYCYYISARGIHFVEKRIPKKRRLDYEAEIREHQETIINTIQ